MLKCLSENEVLVLQLSLIVAIFKMLDIKDKAHRQIDFAVTAQNSFLMCQFNKVNGVSPFNYLKSNINYFFTTHA